MDSYISEDQFRERYGHVLWLGDLDHEAVHFRDGTGERRGGRRIRDAEGGVCAHSVRYGVDFLDGSFLAFASVDNGVGAVVLG